MLSIHVRQYGRRSNVTGVWVDGGGLMSCRWISSLRQHAHGLLAFNVICIRGLFARNESIWTKISQFRNLDKPPPFSAYLDRLISTWEAFVFVHMLTLREESSIAMRKYFQYTFLQWLSGKSLSTRPHCSVRCAGFTSHQLSAHPSRWGPARKQCHAIAWLFYTRTGLHCWLNPTLSPSLD
jgi:hypothetical protein